MKKKGMVSSSREMDSFQYGTLLFQQLAKQYQGILHYHEHDESITFTMTLIKCTYLHSKKKKKVLISVNCCYSLKNANGTSLLHKKKLLQIREEFIH